MDKQNKQQEDAPLTGKGHGPQGIDKAPGEEVAENEVRFTQELKGAKSDADPEQESDKPLSQDSIQPVSYSFTLLLSNQR